jgi:hypothetical protein
MRLTVRGLCLTKSSMFVCSELYLCPHCPHHDFHITVGGEFGFHIYWIGKDFVFEVSWFFEEFGLRLVLLRDMYYAR